MLRNTFGLWHVRCWRRIGIMSTDGRSFVTWFLDLSEHTPAGKSRVNPFHMGRYAADIEPLNIVLHTALREKESLWNW